MRIRTLALGLALCCGLTGMAQAAAKKNSVKSQKSTVKQLKKRNAKRGKQSNAAMAKPRKAKKVKIAKR
jgi:hypothetical protein